MNQILLTEDISKNKIKNTKTISKKQVAKGGTNSTDIKKIITFFAIVIIVFGIAIGAIYGFKIYKNKKQGNNHGTSSNNPSVSITQNEDNTFTIIAQSEAGIDKIIYNWDNGDVEEQEQNGSPTVEEKINIPLGATEVDIQVIDMNGNLTPTTQDISIHASGKEPEIKTSVIETDTGDKKLKIVVTAETEMDSIKYKWNDGEEVKLESQINSKTQEEIIDLERGENIITITAVDIENNTKTITEPYKVLKDPEILVTKNGDRLYMKVTHDIGIKSIEYNVNNKIYTYDDNYSEYDANKKEVEFSFALQNGENTVIITAISLENTEKIYRGKCDYTLEN